MPIICPWKRTWPFIWTNVNPLTPKRRFLNIFDIVLLLHYLPLEKGVVIYFNKLESLLPNDLCTKFGWNWPGGSREEVEIVKSLQTEGRTDEQTDKWQTTGDRKSSLDLSALVNLKRSWFHPELYNTSQLFSWNCLFLSIRKCFETYFEFWIIYS